MNYVDIILLLVMALAVWGGWRQGFIIGSINLIVWIGSLLAGFFLYQYAGELLSAYFPRLGPWTLPIAFLCIVVVTRLLLGSICNLILRKTPNEAHAHGVTIRILRDQVIEQQHSSLVLPQTLRCLDLTEAHTDDAKVRAQ